MIFEISCFIFKKKHFLFAIFTFSKQSFLGILDFWQKTPQNYKSCSKNGQNHQFALMSFKFHQKKIHFSTLTFFLGPLTWNRPTVNLARLLENTSHYYIQLVFNICQI